MLAYTHSYIFLIKIAKEISNKIGFIYNVQTGLVFNPKTSSCDRQENLEVGEKCRTYYNETFIDELRGRLA